jgi:hypothetical protein
MLTLSTSIPRYLTSILDLHSALLDALRHPSKSSPDSRFLSRSKAKFLQKLTDLSEEDETRSISSSISSIDHGRPATTSELAGASRLDPVDITDINENFFSQPPRRAPRPPTQHDLHDDASDDSSIADFSLKFPSPPGHQDVFNSPVTLVRSHATKYLPLRFKKGRHSPASSISGGSTLSEANTNSCSISTPATSEDEDVKPDIVVNPKRFTMIFTKSFPDLHNDVDHESIYPDDIPPQFRVENVIATAEPPESYSDSEEEDPEWIAQDMKDFLTLSASMHPNVIGSSPDEGSAMTRPESFISTPRTSKRYSTVIYPSLGPNAQLDPTFPFHHREKSLYPPVPTRPPPLPPKFPSPHLTASSFKPSTVSLNLKPASSSTPSRSPSTHLSRPPPRVSIPVDVDELMQMDFDDFDLLEEDLKGGLLDAPYSPTGFDYYLSPTTLLGFDPEDFPKRVPYSPGHALPDTPLTQMYEPESAFRRQMTSASVSSSSNRQHLRSRWSTSTLSSISIQQSPTSSWMSKFTLRTKKYKSPSVPSMPAPLHTTKPTKQEKQRKLTGSNLMPAHDRLELGERRIDRRDSRSSRTSSDSAESSSSAGIRRKPIPVEIFMKA